MIFVYRDAVRSCRPKTSAVRVLRKTSFKFGLLKCSLSRRTRVNGVVGKGFRPHTVCRITSDIIEGTLSMTALLKRFAADRRGATAIEYGLIAALIAVVVIGALTNIGTNLSTAFDTVATKLL